MTVSRETILALAAFDSPTISNVIELFDAVPRNAGYMNGEIQAHFPELAPMVGFATTAGFRSSGPPAGGDAYASLEDQVARFADLPGPAVVVFQDLDEPPVGATFGEVMCSTYRAFGSAGLITSGGGRDLEQVEALDYPVFSSATIVSHAYYQILHLGQPVHVGGLFVYEGDLLHGDGNGVTRIPLAIADQVADVAADFIAAEKIVLDYVNEPGEKTPTGLTDARKEFAAAVDVIKTRIGAG